MILSVFLVCLAAYLITDRKSSCQPKPDPQRTDTGHHAVVSSYAVQPHFKTSPLERPGLTARQNVAPQTPRAEGVLEEDDLAVTFMPELPDYSTLTAPMIDDDFQVSAEFIDIMKLSDVQILRIRESAFNQMERVREWDLSHAEVIEESNGKVLSYKVSGSEEFAEGCRMRFAAELKDVIGESNYEMLAGQVESLTRQLSKDVIVSYHIEPSPNGEECFYLFSVQWQKQAAEMSDGFNISGPTPCDIPSRWKNMFSL